MSDDNKPKQDGEELTAEQLEQASGGQSRTPIGPRESGSGHSTGQRPKPTA